MCCLFPSSPLLTDTNRYAYDCYKRVYAEMLFRWNLLISRAKVLKYLSVNHEPRQRVEFITECSTCHRTSRAPVCQDCRKALMKCVLCRLPVKGLANICLNCGHGGHTLHMRKWFSVRFWFISLLIGFYSDTFHGNQFYFFTEK